MKILSIGAFEAKTHLSALLEKVQMGQVFCITKRGRPVAELRPAKSTQQRPVFGCDRGRVTVSVDFDAPLPDFQEYTQ